MSFAEEVSTVFYLFFQHPSSHPERSPLQLYRLDQMGQNVLHVGEQPDEGEHAASVCRRHRQGGDGVAAWGNTQVGWTIERRFKVSMVCFFWQCYGNLAKYVLMVLN